MGDLVSKIQGEWCLRTDSHGCPLVSATSRRHTCMQERPHTRQEDSEQRRIGALRTSDLEVEEDSSETFPTLGSLRSCSPSQDPQQGERMTAQQGMLRMAWLGNKASLRSDSLQKNSAIHSPMTKPGPGRLGEPRGT